MKYFSTLLVFLLLSGAAYAQTEISLDKAKWTELKFNNISANKVEFLPGSINVNVESSASPLIYKLDQVADMTGFELKLIINGAMAEQQKDFEEDSFFRIGLVALGSNHLGAMGRLFAPAWVQQLFKLAPNGAGLDKIYFFSIANSKEQLHKERLNPKSKYMYEKIIATKEGATQDIKYTLTEPLKVAALWLSIDGDNTKSKFTTEIKSIKLINKF